MATKITICVEHVEGDGDRFLIQLDRIMSTKELVKALQGARRSIGELILVALLDEEECS